MVDRKLPAADPAAQIYIGSGFFDYKLISAKRALGEMFVYHFFVHSSSAANKCAAALIFKCRVPKTIRAVKCRLELHPGREAYKIQVIAGIAYGK